jgi:adenosylhomocysteinase
MPQLRADALRSLLNRSYTPADYPALSWQADQWGASRPLAGVRVLDATPAFGNTVAKYLPLVASGADLTVSLSPLLPHDPTVVQFLHNVGIPVLQTPGDQQFDVVMDCAGVLSSTPSRAGYVELTKSGLHSYQDCPKPVFLVDDSRIKLIETSLGTGEAFIRAMAQFGYSDLANRRLLVFGGGKVGAGAARRARDAGAIVTVVDPDPGVKVPSGCDVLDATDHAAVRSAIAKAWGLVTATGHEAALAPLVQDLLASDLVLANLGAEDEFGPTMPADRVLNAKVPVNFALEEPTHLRYLDATLALDNACALALLQGGQPPGINRVPEVLEDEILTIVGAHGAISEELAAIDEEPT